VNAKVLEAIKQSAAVPSVPKVVTRFLEIMQNPDFSYDDLVRILSADPGTVSEILRLVNSALFGVRHKIVALRQALTLLGPMRTRSLLLGRYLVDSMSKRKVPGLDMTYFWRRSLTASVVASRLAEKARPKYRDEIFIGALLADVGIAILAEAVPESYGVFAKRYVPRGKPFGPEEELRAVDLTHGDVSAMVLSHWSLPDLVATAVNLHQSECPGDSEPAQLAKILYAADSIGRVLCEVPDSEEAADTCIKAVTIAGVSLETLVAQLPRMESDIEELAQVLKIDVIPSKVYAQIAGAVQAKLVSV